MMKITGAYRSMLGETEFHERELPLKNPGAFLPAVMVVGDTNDEVPRLFTESEVRAMMDDVKAIAADHSMKCYTNRINQMTPPAPVAFHIDNYLWKSHGLSSDPT